MALATTASHETDFAGLQVLLKTFTARCNGTSSAHLQSQAEQASADQVPAIPCQACFLANFPGRVQSCAVGVKSYSIGPVTRHTSPVL